jgi:hypothetical protein
VSPVRLAEDTESQKRTDIDAAFATLVQQRTDALLVAHDPFFFSRRDQIVARSTPCGRGLAP